MRRATATVDVAAIAANVRRLRREAPRSRVCAVVKANGYGHDAVLAARGALAGGAEWLAVAAADEAAELRAAGVGARLLVMGALTADDLATALTADADVVVWTRELLDALPSSARAHVKLDTGMGRLGTRDAEEATRLADAAAERGLLAGLMTHFATADEREDAFFGEQLARFDAWARPLAARHPGLAVHAANSAAVLREPGSHHTMIRPGLAIYGMDPFGEDPAARELLPALRLTSWVAAVKACAAGESAGYGRRFVAERDTVLATIPIGYGDGWRRALTHRHDVVIGGRRFPAAGTVSMDNIIVDLGPDGAGVAPGDEAVLIGDGITAEELARRSDTINYEITTALLPRVPRVPLNG